LILSAHFSGELIELARQMGVAGAGGIACGAFQNAVSNEWAEQGC